MSQVKKFSRLISFFIIGSFILAIYGCSQPAVISAVGPDGTLTILKPDESFTHALESGRMVILGDPPPASLILTQHESIPILKFSSTGSNFSIVRPIEANLMATPYLDWSWNMADHDTPYHGVSLMVGIIAPEGSPNEYSPSMAPHIKGTPAANRIISIQWSKFALERGHLMPHPVLSANAVTYVARGGSENARQWWRESIDLSNLYARSWPGEDLTKSKIVFIALVAKDLQEGSPAYFSEIKLFR